MATTSRGNPRPGWPGSVRADLVRAVALVVALAAALLAVAVLLRPAEKPAEQACLEGGRLLAAGDRTGAAREFRLAIELDPPMEQAWRGLLEASPTLPVCYDLARNFPRIFDGIQPVQDPELLVIRGAGDAAEWEQALATYEKAVESLPTSPEDQRAVLLRRDLLGRRELASAWAELGKIRKEFRTAARRPPSAEEEATFASCDAEAARKVLVNAADRLDAQKWLDLVRRTDEAARNHRSGMERLEEAAAQDPRFVPTQLTLAYVEIVRGGHAAAEARCRKLLEPSPDIPGEERLRYCLARVLELEGRDAEAAEQMEKILELRPAPPETLLRLGRFYIHLGRVDDATAVADRFARYDPRADYLRGMVSLRRGDCTAALTQLAAGLRDRPFDPSGCYLLARAQFGSGEYLAAAETFRRAAAQAADPAWPLAASAACALAAGDSNSAGETAAGILADGQLLRRHPRLREYALRFRVAAAAQGASPLAEVKVETLAGAADDRDLAHYLIAGVIAGRKCTGAGENQPVSEEELAFFRAAAPAEPSARYCFAFLLACGGRLDEARKELEQLNRERPDYLLAALHLARLLELEGRTEQAARVLERTGQAQKSPEVARALALVDHLQGLRAPTPRFNPADAAQALPGPAGPHLAFFAVASHADHRAFARKLVILDPVSELPAEILRLTYEQVRSRGPDGVEAAALADTGVDRAIQVGLAVYGVGENGLYRLAAGRFWQDAPPDISTQRTNP